LADFLPNWDISRGFLYILFAGRIREAAMGGQGSGHIGQYAAIGLGGSRWKMRYFSMPFSLISNYFYIILNSQFSHKNKKIVNLFCLLRTL
jgi:hypothetical protein